MFLKSIKTVLFSIIFSYQLFGMKPIDISQSIGSEWPNAKLQELKNELQQKDAIINSLRTELSQTKQQLKEVDNLLIKRLLELMDYDYFDVFSDARNKPAIVSIIRENYEFLNRVWDKVIAQNNDKNATRDESLPLPENLEEATLKKFL